MHRMKATGNREKKEDRRSKRGGGRKDRACKEGNGENACFLFLPRLHLMCKKDGVFLRNSCEIYLRFFFTAGSGGDPFGQMYERG